MNAGWIAVSRRVFAHDTLRRGPLCEVAAWIELVARANYEPNPAHDPPLDRGDACVTAGRLATSWGWERGEVRNALARWERAGMIASRSVGRATIVRVLNYDAYQAPIHAPTVRQPCANDAPKERSNNNGLRAESANDAPTMRQPCATITKQENKRTKDNSSLRASHACDAEAAPPGDEGVGEPVEAAPDLSTKAGRARAYPQLSAVPKRGPRYEWPQAFGAFLDAYPNRTRAPGPATYTNWRKLVVDGVEPAALQRAVELYADAALAKSPSGEYVRRAHGPSGWLAAGEWEIYATDAEEVARAAEPREYAAPVVVAPLSSFGCAEWDALEAGLRAQLGASYPPSLAACVGRVVGGVVELHTRDEMAALAAAKHAPALLRLPVDVKLHGV